MMQAKLPKPKNIRLYDYQDQKRSSIALNGQAKSTTGIEPTSPIPTTSTHFR